MHAHACACQAYLSSIDLIGISCLRDADGYRYIQVHMDVKRVFDWAVPKTFAPHCLKSE